MKKIYYLYGTLICALIIVMSLTWGGIMDRYALFYNSESIGVVSQNYSIMNNKYEIQIPDTWKYSVISLPDGKIDYHAEILSRDKKVSGIVQVWNTGTSLMDLLKQLQVSPTDASYLKSYELQLFKTGGHNGYNLKYISKSNENNYSCTEYFIEDKNGIFIRVSFFVKESDYNQDVKKQLENIASTIKIND